MGCHFQSNTYFPLCTSFHPQSISYRPSQRSKNVTSHWQKLHCADSGGWLMLSFILHKLGASPNCTLEEKITFQVNIDGLPLFKSSNSQFWPILGMLDNPPIKEPFIIGLLYGSKKPTSASDFLSCFAAEMKELQMNGLTYNGTLHRVSMSVAICDAPARAFVKNIKYHSGYFGCVCAGYFGVGHLPRNTCNMLHYELMHSSMKWQMRDTTEAHHHSES